MAEPKYIDAAPIIEDMRRRLWWVERHYHPVTVDDLDEKEETIKRIKRNIRTLEDAQAVKVRPLVEAEWEERDVEVYAWFGTTTQRRFYCGACGKWQSWGKTKWCPECGAKMMNGPEGKRCSD